MQQKKKQPQRRYRLNKKRFATVLLLLGITVALVVIVTNTLGGQVLDALVMAPGFEGPLTVGKDRTQSEALDGRLIVLDAGHGGADPGAMGISGVREDELVLAITQYLKAELESCGAKVIMTREDDGAIADTKDADMAERRRIIAESGSDIVVSIHLNWFEDPQVSGPLVLFMPGSEKGQKLAVAVQQSLNTALDASGSARSENLYILKSGNQPCILVECGYLSNEEEEQKLMRSDYQQRVAKAICSGLAAYFS